MTGAASDPAKIAAARIWAAARMPYLATALFAADVRAVPDIGTVAIDPHWRITADPERLAGLAVPELGRLFVHLVWHLLREHPDRAGLAAVSDPRWWNLSGDAEINDDLLPLDCRPASAPTVPTDLGCTDGGLAEEYYAARPRPELDRWDCGSGADGRPRDWDRHGSPCPRCGGSDLSRCRSGAQLRAQVAAAVQQEHQREPGSVPAGLLRWAESVLPSRVDWRRVLAAEIRRAVAAVAGAVDYSYRRPSRRAAVVRPAVLPSLVRPVPEVAVVCDTSGSMDDTLLARALAEIEGLLTRAGLRSVRLRVLAVDTAVHAVRRVSSARQVELLGSGGTDMGVGIDAAARLTPRPTVVVVLTDGYTPWPDRPPRGIRVVVGLLESAGEEPPDPPAWARTVRIPPD
jgi:predicted metal-dependent peptidase